MGFHHRDFGVLHGGVRLIDHDDEQPFAEGQPALVISSTLTGGTAGLYQVTIQIPANLSAGPAALEASIGGARTQPNLTLYIGN